MGRQGGEAQRYRKLGVEYVRLPSRSTPENPLDNPAKFGYRDGLMTEVNYRGSRYEVVQRYELIDPRRFFQISAKGDFDNNDALRLYSGMVYTYVDNDARDARAASDYDLLLGERDAVDKLKEQSIIQKYDGDLEDDAAMRVHKWFNEAKNRTKSVVRYTTEIPEVGVTFVRYLVGDVLQEENARLINEEAIETALFMQLSLGFGLDVNRDPVMGSPIIFEFAELDDSDSEGGFLANEFISLTSAGGRYQPQGNVMMVYDYGIRYLDPAEGRDRPFYDYVIGEAVDVNNVIELTRHEIAHFYLANSDYVVGHELTESQEEGLCMMVQNKYDPRKFVAELCERDFDFSKLTVSILEQVFSLRVPDEMNYLESRYLTGALFAYIFQTLGENRFRGFLDEITYYDRKLGSGERCGKLFAALDYMSGDDSYWVNAQSYIDEFIQWVEECAKRYKKEVMKRDKESVSPDSY